MTRYYLDACIWRDYFENRSDKFRPLGEWALALIKKIIHEEGIILYSDLIEDELKVTYSETEIKSLLSIVPKEILIKIISSPKQLKEAVLYSKKFNIPKKDALHAILASENNAILVTRDKHFYEIWKELVIKKPEDLI
jgi:predicted nucleic acid-binding protein